MKLVEKRLSVVIHNYMKMLAGYFEASRIRGS